MQARKSPAPGRQLFVLWFAWLAFIVYGSLVPLERNQRSLAEALELFQRMPYFHLGVTSRADWIANGVLYLPLGLLTAYGLMQIGRRVSRLWFLLPAWAFCAAVAVAVEFTQLFFPPRTVSLNDLLAEGIGSGLGVGLALRGDWIAALLTALWRSEARLRRLALQGYGLAYLAFSLFPYDVLISLAEIRDKAASSGWGWFVAGDGNGLGRILLNAGVETVLTLPLGYYLAARRGGAGLRPVAAVGLGAGLGSMLELAQFFLASGTSQGLSVLTRTLGVLAGAQCWRTRAWLLPETVRVWLRRLGLPTLLAYLPLLAYVNGYFSRSWQGVVAAREQWANVHWLPFYYHYYTTEMQALHSLVSIAAAYAPLAVLAWAWRRGMATSVLAALVLSALVEAGKCFLTGTHPDPTNVLVAVGSVWLVVAGWIRLVAAGQDRGAAEPLSLPVEVPGARLRVVSAAGLDRAQVLWMLPVGLAVGWWLLGFPSARPLVATVLLMGGLLAWRQPAFALAMLVAALPVFDLAPWSGRVFLDEFDALATVCLGVAWLRTPAPADRRTSMPPLDLVVLLLIAASLGLGIARGLGMPEWPDLNAFVSDYSRYNALRVGKGVLWAVLAGGLAWRLAAGGTDPLRPVAWGMIAGLALCVLSVLWERLAFASLTDFSGEYRVTGLISAMHTGGAYLEAYLIVATPFLVVLLAERAGWAVRLAGGALLLAASYALLVTFSRGGYAGFGVALLAALLLSFGAQPRQRLGRGLAWSGVLLGSVLLLAWPVIRGGFAQARLEAASSDWTTRQAHWHDVMQIRDDDAWTEWLGMGLGSFPAANYWRSVEHFRPASFALAREGGNILLRLAPGDPVGLEQIIATDADGQYRLSADLKPSGPGAELILALCEKWLLTSATCHWERLAVSGPGWQRIEHSFQLTEFGSGHPLRPVKLSLSYATPDSTLALDNLRLIDAQGVDLLANGDFSHGLDHWFPVANGIWHGHWHPHNLWYGTRFELGWLGVCALSALGLLSCARALGAWHRGERLPAAPVAALAGVLTLGASDTVLDAPRFLFLLLWLNLLVLLVRESPGNARWRS